MGRKLSNVIEPTAVITLLEAAGKYFKGILLDTGREVKMKRGKSMVYSFKLVDTDMGSQIKNSSGEYEEKEINKDDVVSLFAPTVLRKALEKTQPGKQITIIYLGRVESQKGGSDYHNFDVEEE